MPDQGREQQPDQPPPDAQPPTESPPPQPKHDPQVLLAAMKRLSVKSSVEKKQGQDNKQQEQTFRAIGTMVLYELDAALGRIDVLASENAPDVLTLELATKQDGVHVIYVLSGVLNHRVSESEEVELWKDEAEIGKSRVGMMPKPQLMRSDVLRFFKKLTDAYESASEGR
jgi:hypothetical protein